MDESGDFGAYNHITPYYIITMILHDQSMDISEQVRNLDAKVRSLGYGEKFAMSTELSTYSYRKVLPIDYKLFQVADLICTLELLDLKCEHGELSRSEQLIFHSKRELRKQFIKPLQKKMFPA